MHPYQRFPNSPTRRWKRSYWLAAGAILTLLLGVAIGVWWTRPQTLLSPSALPRAVTPRGDLAEDEKSNIELYRNSFKSVVYVNTVSDPYQPFRLGSLDMPAGSGSGFIWDEHGHIVTNSHVVEGDEQIRVTLWDQSVWTAQIVGLSRDKDLAVLKLDSPASKLQAIPLGTSADLNVGQKVFAIGNPFGLGQTFSTGVISGLGREIRSKTGRAIQDVIQSDAPINPGNSGGPLLDSAGRLIGVNTSIYSQSGMHSGIGFAIPADTVNRIIPQLLRHGRVIRPAFGVHLASDQVARQLELEGVLVLRVHSGSSAEKVGMKSTTVDAHGNTRLGDVIFEVDGKLVRNSDDLYAELESRAVGESVPIKIRRNPRTDEEEILAFDVILREDAE